MARLAAHGVAQWVLWGAAGCGITAHSGEPSEGGRGGGGAPTVSKDAGGRVCAAPPDVPCDPGGGQPDPLIDAKGWTWTHPVPHGYDQRAVWAVGDGVVWTAGVYGALTKWLEGRSYVVDPAARLEIRDLWGSAGDDVWAVGQWGTILHSSAREPGRPWSDGEHWTSVPSPTPGNLSGVSGVSADDVWAVGQCGIAAHWDGSKWSLVESGSRETLRSVLGRARDDVWAVGMNATALHYDGECWEPADGGMAEIAAEHATPLDCNRAFGLGAEDVSMWCVVDPSDRSPTLTLTVSWNGVRWTQTESSASPPLPAPEGTTALDSWGPPDDRWIAGTDGYFAHIGEEGVSEYSRPYTQGTPPPNFASIWGAPDGSAVAVSDQWWSIHHWDGSTWRSTWSGVENPTLARKWFADVWGASAKDVWAVGEGVVVHFDGTEWQQVRTDSASYRAIWGANATELWVVSTERDEAFVLRGDGTEWTTEVADSVEYRDITGAAGHVWAVGFDKTQASGVVLHFDGSAWTKEQVGQEPLVVVTAAGPDRAWAFGRDGAIFAWAGLTWTFLRNAGVRFSGAWASSADDVWAVGSNLGSVAGETVGGGSAVLHWNGSDWVSTPRPPGLTLRGVWGGGPAGIWVVGDGGAILQYRP